MRRIEKIREKVRTAKGIYGVNRKTYVLFDLGDIDYMLRLIEQYEKKIDSLKEELNSERLKAKQNELAFRMLKSAVESNAQ